MPLAILLHLILTDTRTYLSGDISWTVNDTKSNYRVGLVAELLRTEITEYGFDVRGDKAHIITGGYTSLTKYVTIKPGDVLSVTVRNMQVTYKLNGQTVHHEYVWSLRAWRFCIKYGKGETHITDLTVNGTPVTSFTTRGTRADRNTQEVYDNDDRLCRQRV